MTRTSIHTHPKVTTHHRLSLTHLQTLHGKPHFTSLHGKVGALTLLLLLLTTLIGGLSFRRLGLLPKLPTEAQPKVKWAHRLAGVTVWTLAIVCMQLDLPHPAVFTGLVCRAWQVGVVALGVGVVVVLRAPGRGKSILPQLYTGGAVGVGTPQGPKHL
jgi:Eukaryotic cytochrome b561